MAIELQSSAQLAQVHGVKVCVYGEAGAGKTMLTATAPNPVLISAESGLLSLNPTNIARVHGMNTPGISYDIPVIPISTIDELVDVSQWASESHEAQGFQTVCLDSISEIAEVVLANERAKAKDPRQAYGELATKMQETIRFFRDLQGKHVYMAAKCEKSKDDQTGMFLYGPSMPGNTLKNGLDYYFDEVFFAGTGTYMNEQQQQVSYNYLRTKKDMQYRAKDRSGCLDELEAPNLTSIFNKIIQGVQ